LIADDNLTIAIVYNSESKVIRGISQDLLALQSTSDTASILYDTLKTLGYHTEMIKINGSLNSLKKGLEKLFVTQTLVFNLCDGFKGEITAQACVTRLITALSFPQTGSPENIILNCTDKAKAKEILRLAGLPTPDYQIFEQPSGQININFPVIVKPLFEDGSIGINSDSVAQTPEDTFHQIDYVIQNYEQPALVEEFISGREISVSVWGNSKLNVLPMIEHDFSLVADPLAHVLTYEAKWIPDYYYGQSIVWRCPAEIPDEMNRSLADTAKKAYRALGLRDFARIDFRYYQGIPYILDINEIPDLHPEAGFAQSALAAGYSYEAMVQNILDIALKREGLLS
jgi:D-alanine-D-alanine ligase